MLKTILATITGAAGLALAAFCAPALAHDEGHGYERPGYERHGYERHGYYERHEHHGAGYYYAPPEQFVVVPRYYYYPTPPTVIYRPAPVYPRPFPPGVSIRFNFPL